MSNEINLILFTWAPGKIWWNIYKRLFPIRLTTSTWRKKGKRMTTAKPFVLSNQILDIWLWSVSLLLTIIKFIIQNYYDFPCMKYLIIHTETQTDTNTYTNTVILLCSSEFFWQETKRKYLLELLVMLLLLTFPFWRSNYPKQNGNRFKSFFLVIMKMYIEKKHNFERLSYMENTSIY